jgi:hypothetical protein
MCRRDVVAQIPQVRLGGAMMIVAGLAFTVGRYATYQRQAVGPLRLGTGSAIDAGTARGVLCDLTP